MDVQCPNCKKIFRNLKEENKGKRRTCGICKHKFTLVPYNKTTTQEDKKQNTPATEPKQDQNMQGNDTQGNDDHGNGNHGNNPQENDDQRYNLLKTDYCLVHDEVLKIKSCRSSIFVGTLGVISTLGAAILTIIGSEFRSNLTIWLPLATLIPIALLTCALLSTVYKARNMNIRFSFLEVAGEIIAQKITSIKYLGWQKTRRILERCQIYIDIDIPEVEGCEAIKNCKYHSTDGNKCADGDECVEMKSCANYKKKKPKEPGCLKAARNKASTINHHLRFFTPMLHSFTSLSTYIYSIAYLISVFIFVYSTMPTMKTYYLNFDNNKYLLIAFLVSAISCFLSIMAFKNKRRAQKERDYRDNITFFESLLKVCGWVTGFTVPLLFLLIIYLKSQDPDKTWHVYMAYLVGALITSFLIYVWYSCYDKIDSLRRGRYSLERWRHLCKIFFYDCPLMETETTI